MLNTILKHIIYEACISVFFQKIDCNFSAIIPEENIKEVRLGNMVFKLRKPMGAITDPRSREWIHRHKV